MEMTRRGSGRLSRRLALRRDGDLCPVPRRLALRAPRPVVRAEDAAALHVLHLHAARLGHPRRRVSPAPRSSPMRAAPASFVLLDEGTLLAVRPPAVRPPPPSSTSHRHLGSWNAPSEGPCEPCDSCARRWWRRLVLARERVAQDTPQALRQEIDQLRKDFEALKQQYGDRLTALEAKLAAGGTPPATPAATAPPAAGRSRAAARSREAAAPTDARLGASQQLEGLQPGHRGHRRFSRRRRQATTSTRRRRSRCTSPKLSFQAVVDPYARADFFIVVRRGRGRARGRVRHADLAARRPADQGRQDARGVRQGQHAAQSHPAVGGSAAGDAEPGRRRGRDRRCGHLGGAADPEPVDLPRGDRPDLPRRFRRRCSSRPSAAI